MSSAICDNNNYKVSAAPSVIGLQGRASALVFQCLRHTLDLPNELWRVMDQAHRKRNLAEYEGYIDVDERLLDALIRVAIEVADRVSNLPGRNKV